MLIRRDKSLQKYTPTDAVKYFARKFREINKYEYPLVYARDCTLMVRIFEKFDLASISIGKVFEFIDVMFDEYPRRERTEAIDVRFLLATVDIFLYKKLNKKPTKIKSPTELTPEVKEWLRQEKLKWLGK